jgi:CBS domain-containing protein
MMNNIVARDVMSRNPITEDSEESVIRAAQIMRDKGISSILVLKNNVVEGIVTERDLVTKIVSKGLDPAKITLGEIMSSPLISVNEDTPLELVAELMWKNKIRRLPVKRENVIVGILTENDIVRISPGLIEITREISGDKNYQLIAGLHGICDRCHEYSNNLVYRAGKYYCELCYSDIISSLNE